MLRVPQADDDGERNYEQQPGIAHFTLLLTRQFGGVIELDSLLLSGCCSPAPWLPFSVSLSLCVSGRCSSAAFLATATLLLISSFWTVFFALLPLPPLGWDALLSPLRLALFLVIYVFILRYFI